MGATCITFDSGGREAAGSGDLAIEISLPPDTTHQRRSPGTMNAYSHLTIFETFHANYQRSKDWALTSASNMEWQAAPP